MYKISIDLYFQKEMKVEDIEDIIRTVDCLLKNMYGDWYDGWGVEVNKNE